MAYKVSSFVVALLLSATFLSNEAMVLDSSDAANLGLAGEASVSAMESVFYRSEQTHMESMAKITSALTNSKALAVLRGLNKTTPSLLQFAEKAMTKGASTLRGRTTPVATSGGDVTQKQADKTNSGITFIRNMMNEMVYDSMAKYDNEIDKCTKFYATTCLQMELARGKIQGANSRAANARALMLDSQACINNCEEEIPDTKMELKNHISKCKHDLKKLNDRLKILLSDLKQMDKILKLVEKSCVSSSGNGLLLQGGAAGSFADGGHVEICYDECDGTPFFKTKHQVHELKSSVGVKALIDVVKDAATSPAAASFLELRSRIDPGMNKTKFNNPPVPKTLVPSNPCTDPDAGAPSLANKRAAKCVIKGDCGPMKEKFLEVQAAMEEERDVVKQAIEDLSTHCEEDEDRLTHHIKTLEDLLDKCQTNLATSTEKQNDAGTEADETSQEHHSLHAALAKTMAECSQNYIDNEGEICALKKIRGEVFQLAASGQKPFFVDCKLSTWAADECSVECGGGTQNLFRSIVTKEQEGAKCLPQYAIRNCKMTPCPVDCKLEPWQRWSACSADCGGGVKQRVREMTVAPKYGGKSCGATSETKPCNIEGCDLDCVLAEWTPWSKCSKMCDGGTQKRQRHVTQQPTGKGKCADMWSPERLEYKACNAQRCQLAVDMPTMKCTHYPMDVVVLIDGSYSLGKTGWEAELLAADTLLSAFQGKGKAADSMVHVSVILYSGPFKSSDFYNCLKNPKMTGNDRLEKYCKVHIVSHMNPDIAAVRGMVKKLKWLAGSTLTSQALFAASEELSLGRDYAKSYVIVITDGRPLYKGRTRKAAHEVRKKARLLWVAVTKYAPLKEIKQMTTRRWEENLITVKSFDDLKNKKEEMTNHIIADVCEAPETALALE